MLPLDSLFAGADIKNTTRLRTQKEITSQTD